VEPAFLVQIHSGRTFRVRNESPVAVSPSLRDRVLERMGLVRAPAPDPGGLLALYEAWCTHVPFDNVRKMLALRTPGAPLPGITSEDFFEGWLRHGAGGTCWSSSHALWALLVSAGFNARRVVASMRDTGIGSHGTVKVSLEGRDWLVDSSMLTNAPVPCDQTVFIGTDPVWPVESEPIEGTHLIWFDSVPSGDAITCRVLQDPADPGWYLTAYEASREQSPFNRRLYARKNFPGQARLFVGPTRYSKTAAGVDVRTLSRDELCEALRTEMGISAELVAEWAASGSLDESFEPVPGPTPPPPAGIRPSLRADV